MRSPCKNCTLETGRSVEPNCHMICEKYLAYKEVCDREKEQREKDAEVGATLFKLAERRGKLGGTSIVKKNRQRRERYRNKT